MLHRGLAFPPKTAEEYQAFLGRLRRSNQVGRFVIGPDDALAGFIGISEIVRGSFQSAYLGYYAFVPLAGRGYMRAGLRLALGLAFQDHGLHRIEANIQPGNARSIALVRSLGFRYEGYSPRYLRLGGRWRDHERWALTVEDWKCG